MISVLTPHEFHAVRRDQVLAEYRHRTMFSPELFSFSANDRDLFTVVSPQPVHVYHPQCWAVFDGSDPAPVLLRGLSFIDSFGQSVLGAAIGGKHGGLAELKAEVNREDPTSLSLLFRVVDSKLQVHLRTSGWKPSFDATAHGCAATVLAASFMQLPIRMLVRADDLASMTKVEVENGPRWPLPPVPSGADWLNEHEPWKLLVDLQNDFAELSSGEEGIGSAQFRTSYYRKVVAPVVRCSRAVSGSSRDLNRAAREAASCRCPAWRFAAERFVERAKNSG